MGMVKLAAGVAVGYVLGARAGREKYEQIVAQARKLGGTPEAPHDTTEAQAAPTGGTGTATMRLTEAATSGVQPDAPAPRKPRQPRRAKAAPVTPPVGEIPG